MAMGSFVNAMHALGVVSLVLMLHRGDATMFTVGGSKGWCVPSGNNGAVFNQWAEKMRFQVGDSILFVYPSGSDSVLQVSKDDYNSCTTTSPIKKYTDGHTEFKFTSSGPYYFISGNKDNCNKNEKLVLVVMADRTNKTSPPSPTAPAPAPKVSEHDQQPPIASPPTDTGATLGPASPPTDDGSTSQVPSAESNPPNNGAASTAMTFVGSVGVFLGSSLILGF